jgi:hypothetical protein
LFAASAVTAQENVTTFGLQLRPLVPNKFVGFEPVGNSDEGFEATWEPRVSMSFGMVIRWGFTKSLSLETGINMLRRNYRIDLFETPSNVRSEINYAFVGYEVPIQALFYVPLSTRWWMNGAGGVSIDTYPSSTFSLVTERPDAIEYAFEQFTARRNWAQVALQANYGFEYRTKDSGYYYVGVTYHRPFNTMADSEAVLRYPGEIKRAIVELSGTYFTVDFRYFFHEKPKVSK